MDIGICYINERLLWLQYPQTDGTRKRIMALAQGRQLPCVMFTSTCSDVDVILTAMQTSGCFIPDIDKWDPQEFGISQKEARQVSPGQGLLLHVTHNALQDSGIDYRGKAIGVYVGGTLLMKGWAEDITTAREYFTTGTFPSLLANRLSYVFDLTGEYSPPTSVRT
jgi:3-oxoacyl-(acyl-carrier-protein) synthase